jgi:hypothetical protein
VLLNGVAGRPFKHRRGLRQGDPLSPLLFDLAIDPLQLLIQQATTSGILNPLPIKEASLRLSLYADDAIIFANPRRDELDVLLDIVTGFGNASGLRINVAKCTVSPIRCSDIDLDSVLSGFNGHVTQFPITYLGLPLTWEDCALQIYNRFSIGVVPSLQHGRESSLMPMDAVPSPAPSSTPLPPTR